MQLNKKQAGVDFLTKFIQVQEMFGNRLLIMETFRKNHAGVGYTYDDQTRDAFIAPKPFNSWILK
jgi:hypothetical protein